MGAETADELEVDLAGLLGEPGALAGTLHRGGPGDLDRPLLVGLPGGTYTRGYWDLQVPGAEGYSFAEAMAERGLAVLALDNLGTGASARPRAEVTFALQARAATAAVSEVRERIGHRGPVVGVGHSMGGWLVTLQQAEAAPYAALAVLGTTNQHVAPLGLTDELTQAASSASARRAFVEQTVAAFPEPYLEAGREAGTGWFHLDDVPAEVVAADDATTLTCVPRHVVAESLVPGLAAGAAARVRVPVLLAYGEVDVSPAPHREPAFFTSSPDVTLVVLAGSGHCHNMATTRRRLWDRLTSWFDAVV